MITKPTDIPNCVIWLDASDKSTLSQTASGRPGSLNVLPNATVSRQWNKLVTNGAGVWLAVGSNGFVTSTNNGHTWSAVADFTAGVDDVHAATYGNNKWICIEKPSSTLPVNYFISDRSTAGSWAIHTLSPELTTSSINSLIYSDFYKRFIGVADTINTTINPQYIGIVSNTSGVDWLSASCNISTGGAGFLELVEGVYMPNNRLVACGSGGNTKFGYSDDGGLTWVKGSYNAPQNLQPSHTWTDVAYGYDNNINLPVSGRFVAVNNNVAGTYQVGYSDDGINWLGTKIDGLSGLRTVAYGGGIFLAAPGALTTAQTGVTSLDGITWNTVPLTTLVNRPPVATGGWSSIRYGNGFFNLVTTASAGTAPALFANTYWPTLSDRYETIGHWADKSGTGRHFSATVAGYTDRPLFLPTLSALYFNGSTTYLTLTSDIPYTAQTTILVMRPRNVNVWRSVYTQTQLPSADNIIYSPLRYRVNGGTAPSINHYEVYQDRPGLGRVDGAATFKGSRRPDQYDIVTCVHTGTNVYIRSNNSLGSYTGGQLNLNHTMNVSRIGAAISGNLSPININYTYAELDLSEVIVYNRALTNPELEDINYYLARKWYHIHRLFRPTYPVVNSLLSDMSTFSISGEPVPFNQLLPECDTIFTNYKTITADVDLNITGRWGFFLPSVINSPMGSITKTGGNVVLANNVTISADFFQNTAACFVTLLPRASATIVGNLSAGTYGSTTNGAVLSGTDVQSLNLIGNISGRDLVQDHNGSTAVGVYWRSTQTLNITGNILPTTWSTTMIQNVSTGTVNVYGDILMHRGSRDQDVHTGIRNDSAGAIWLFGNINHPNMQVVGSGATAIINNSTGSVYVSGNIWAGKKNNYTGYGITNVSTGTVQVTGNVYGGGCWTPASNPNNAIGIYQTGNGVVRVLGNVYSLEDIYDTYSNHGVAITTGRLMVDCEVIETDGRKSSAIYSTSTNPVSVINVQKVLNSKSGGQAINAYKVQIIPSSSTPTYINHSTGPDTEPVKYWTANTTFTYPDSADVRSGTIYNNNTLTGVMVVPPQSSVFLGVPIDLQNVIASQIIPNNYYQIVTLGTTNYLNLGASENTPGTYFTATNPGSGSGTVSMVGTAFISPQSIWNTQISTLPNYDSTSSKILTNTLTTHELTALRTGIGFRAAPKISLFSFTDFWGDLLQWNDEVVFESLDDLQPLKIQGLQLWLDGSDSSTVYTDDGKNLATNNGDIIYRWSDKSGNDNHAIQPIVVNRPLLNIKTNGINYKNTLTFDGVDDSLAANIPGYRNFTALTIIGVISTTLSAAPNTVTMSIGSHGNIGTSANGYPGNKGLGIASFTSGLPNETITILAENATANSGRLGSSTYMRAANTVQAIHVELNNTGTNMYTNNIATILDQTLQITSSTNITPNQYGYTLDDIFNIGALRANGNLTQHTNQKFAELLIYNRVLTNTERTNLWAYLQAKWNII